MQTRKTTLEIDYSWSAGTNAWVNSMKEEFTYTSGNLTSTKTYSWNAITQWVGLARTDYFYSGGNLSYDISYTWDLSIGGADKWAPDVKTVYTFSSGKMTLDKSYKYDKNIAGWEAAATEKTDYAYDLSGKMISAISSIGVDPTWVFSSKTEYTSPGGINTTINYNYVDPNWVPSGKIESTSDLNGVMTMNSIYSYIELTSSWMGISKIVYSSGVTPPTPPPGNIAFRIATNYPWNILGNTWAGTANNRTTYYYSNQTTSINNKVSEKDLRVYPNPAQEFIVFDFTVNSESVKTEIFDIQGRKVFEQQLSENKQISVSNLRKGLYVYKVYNNGIIYTGKFLKE